MKDVITFQIESYKIDIIEPSWLPPPREYATLVQNPKKLNTFILIGGMNYTTVKEISELRLENPCAGKIRVQWTKVEYECGDKVEP